MDEVAPRNPRFDSTRGSDSDGSPLLQLRGELDMLSAVDLREAVKELVDLHCDRLVFDLADLEFMDSSGIAVLVYAASSIRIIELRNTSPTIRRIIEVTGLSNVLKLDPA
jgi:anti-sigma B factor antagonist